MSALIRAGTLNCHSRFVLDSLADWKPVKITKHRRDGVELFCPRHDPTLLLWSPYVIGQTIIFLPCGFYLLFFPRLISAVGDWMSTILPHIWCGLSANVECMSEMCCTRLAENTGRKKSPFWHHRTTLSGCIFATKACIDNRKKTCYTTISPHRFS